MKVNTFKEELLLNRKARKQLRKLNWAARKEEKKKELSDGK